MTKIFIGIDTGTHKCGWAIVDEYGFLINSSVWLMHDGDKLDRLSELQTHVNKFLSIRRGFDILAVGLEEPFVGKNKKTALVQAYAWGVLFARFRQSVRIVYEISPTEAKVALTSNSRASKDEMVAAVKLQFSFDAAEDEADAIGNALAARSKWLETHVG